MHQHSMVQAVSFLIPLMERESEPVYLFLYFTHLYIACLANLHTHASWLRTSILKVQFGMMGDVAMTLQQHTTQSIPNTCVLLNMH